jgi:hypothetical protein
MDETRRKAKAFTTDLERIDRIFEKEFEKIDLWELKEPG